ncbi:MAG: helix-turn-helix domain-containing protein, partial [Firmicutes bacterium]|nr:helix-turn-helix domain-containing protein [Bacillota bacterium]
IELARAALARNPRTRILVISGYDEFSYAKACLEIGVCGYILKPTPPEEILQAVLKQRDFLLARQADEQFWASLRHQLDESMPFLREQFLRDLWRGEVEESRLADRLRFLQFGIEPNQPVVALVLEVKDNVDFYLNHDEKERQLIWFALYNLVQAALGSGGFAARLERGGVGALVFGTSGCPAEELPGLANRIARSLLDQARLSLPCALAIGIGGVAENVAASYRSFDQARQALLVQTGFPVESLAHHASCCSHVQLPFLSLVDEERLGVNLETGATAETIPATVRRLLGYDPSHPRGAATSEWRRESGLVLAGVLARIGHRNGLTIREIMPAEDYSLLMRGGPDAEEPEDVIRWWETQFGRLGHAIRRLQRHKLRGCIRKAQEFIEANLGKTISLSQVAREVYMSPSYLSRLFREQTGESFSEYVTRRKMEVARRLLDEGEKKIYEIAAAVGYTDPAYFGRVFRQIFNVTPTDYRTGHKATS